MLTSPLTPSSASEADTVPIYTNGSVGVFSCRVNVYEIFSNIGELSFISVSLIVREVLVMLRPSVTSRVYSKTLRKERERLSIVKTTESQH